MSKGEKMPSVEASRVAMSLVMILRDAGIEAEVAGSLRRHSLYVGDIDVLVYGDPRIIWELPGCEPASGGEKIANCTWEGIKINAWRAELEHRGSMLLFATGSGKWNVMMRSKAKKKGFKLNRYGLWDAKTEEIVASVFEETIFCALGMLYVSPEDREVE